MEEGLGVGVGVSLVVAEDPGVPGLVDRGDLWALTALGRWVRMASDRWAQMDQRQWALMARDPWDRWVQG